MADVIVLTLLALVDLGFLVYLRWRRSLRKRRERMTECLSGYVQRENRLQLQRRQRLIFRAS